MHKLCEPVLFFLVILLSERNVILAHERTYYC